MNRKRKKGRRSFVVIPFISTGKEAPDVHSSRRRNTNALRAHRWIRVSAVDHFVHERAIPELSLTFDRYNQHRQLQLIGLDEHGNTFAGMAVNDVPPLPIQQALDRRKKIDAMPDGAAKTQAEAQLRKQNRITPRYFAGKSRSGNAVVMLRDATGAPRWR